MPTKQTQTIRTLSFSADLITPTGTLLALKKKYSECFLLESVESNKYKGRYSVIGLLPDKKFIVKNDKIFIESPNGIIESEINEKNTPFSVLEEELSISALKGTNLPPHAAGWFGYFGYEMVQYMEKIKCNNNKPLDIADCLLIRPRIIIIFDNISDRVTISAPYYQDSHELIEAKESLLNEVKNSILEGYTISLQESIESDRNKKNSAQLLPEVGYESGAFKEQVKKAVEYIKAGDIFQVVLSRRFRGTLNSDPLSFYRILREINPSPFLFFFDFGEFVLTGSSPEIMVRVNENKVTLRPLAGTRKRGKTQEEDAMLAEELLNDKKEVAEHLMLLDLGRNDVGRVAKPGSVKVTKKMEIEKYSHVMHISSTVEGELAKNSKITDALKAGFPAGTVSGAPKIRAMEIIAETEKSGREFYAGCVGYFSNISQTMDMAITLRTALIKDNQIYVQSGAGIVYDSDAESEEQETINKAGALAGALSALS